MLVINHIKFNRMNDEIDIGKIDEVYNGEKLSTKVHLKNDKSEKITCNVTAVLYSTNYTGEKAKFIKRLKYTDVKMEPKGGKYIYICLFKSWLKNF